MFYDFEEEEKENRQFYSASFGILFELSDDELQKVIEVTLCALSDDEEGQESLLQSLEELEAKVSYLQNVTKLKAELYYFTPENVEKFSKCFPNLKNVFIKWSNFSIGAIEAFKNFKYLQTLKINDYDPETYYRIQEFGNLRQLHNLIIENSTTKFYNFDSLAFLKNMNLNKLEIENLLCVYTPVINGQFNRLQNNKTLQQRESYLNKNMENSAPGSECCLKAAAQLFVRGKIEKGIEYLYMYAKDDQADLPIPFTVSQDPANKEILHWQWHENEKITMDYFKKRKFLLTIYPKTQVNLNEFEYFLR